MSKNKKAYPFLRKVLKVKKLTKIILNFANKNLIAYIVAFK